MTLTFWSKRKKEATVRPTDTRLEIVSEGLTRASTELQDFVGLLRQKYQYTPDITPVREVGNDDAAAEA